MRPRTPRIPVLRSLGTLALGLALAVLVAVPSATAEQSVDRTATLAAGAGVEISNLAGSVTVEGWSGSDVRITGTLGDDVEELRVENHGGHLEIQVKGPEGSHNRRLDLTSHLTIRVPSNAPVEVGTVSAAIAISGLSGDVELETVSGRVTSDGRPGELDITTVSGSVETGDADGDLEIETVSGSVTVTGVEGSFSITSVSGRIQVDAGLVDSGEASNVSGDTSLALDLARGGELSVENHSGDLDLALGSGSGAQVEVSSFSGEIVNELGPPAERTSKYAPGSAVEFTLGNGEGSVEVENFSGRVTIRAR